MTTNSGAIINSLRVRPELLLQFFVTFARFEYALKAADFRKDPPATAEVSWDKFIISLESLPPAQVASVLQAGRYLLENPPKKLVVSNHNPHWEVPGRDGQSDIRFLLEGVRRARNNLLHGGKWLTPPEPPDRNHQVLSTGLRVLHALLALDASYPVRKEFEELS